MCENNQNPSEMDSDALFRLYELMKNKNDREKERRKEQRRKKKEKRNNE